MPYEIKYAGKGKLIIVRHAGSVDCKEITEAALVVDRLVNALDPPYLLVDLRAATGLPTLDEILESRRLRPRQSPLVEKLAYVTNCNYSQTVEGMALGHIKSGISVHVFTGELEAMEWLFRPNTAARLETMVISRIYE